jgi:hypothetical protein
LKFQKKLTLQQFSIKRLSTFSQLITHSSFFHISQPTAAWLGFLGAFAIVKSQKSTKRYGFVPVAFRKVAFCSSILKAP